MKPQNKQYNNKKEGEARDREKKRRFVLAVATIN